MDTSHSGGFICSRHNIGYGLKGKCPSCEWEKNMSLSVLLSEIQDGQIAKATFAFTEYWYVTKSQWGAIYYCDENGKHDGELVPLTYSNLNASYEIIN